MIPFGRVRIGYPETSAEVDSQRTRTARGFITFRLRFHRALDKRRHKSSGERSLERIPFSIRGRLLSPSSLPGYKRKDRQRGDRVYDSRV